VAFSGNASPGSFSMRDTLSVVPYPNRTGLHRHPFPHMEDRAIFGGQFAAVKGALSSVRSSQTHECEDRPRTLVGEGKVDRVDQMASATRGIPAAEISNRVRPAWAGECSVSVFSNALRLCGGRNA
jgi:hypothetical protein